MIPIYTKEEFLGIPESATGEYVLQNDIDLGEFIDSFPNIISFKGVLDGAGFNVKYKVLATDLTGSYAGLFHTPDDCTIKNLNLDADIYLNLNESPSHIGALVSDVDSESTTNFTNIKATIEMKVKSRTSSPDRCLGGLVGSLGVNGVLKNIKVAGNLTILDGNKDWAIRYMGGVVGHLAGELTNVYSCLNLKRQSEYIFSIKGAGGLIGWASANGRLNNFTIESDLVEGHGFYGGIVGLCENTTPFKNGISKIKTIRSYKERGMGVLSGDGLARFSNLIIANDFLETPTGYAPYMCESTGAVKMENFFIVKKTRVRKTGDGGEGSLVSGYSATGSVFSYVSPEEYMLSEDYFADTLGVEFYEGEKVFILSNGIEPSLFFEPTNGSVYLKNNTHYYFLENGNLVSKTIEEVEAGGLNCNVKYDIYENFTKEQWRQMISANVKIVFDEPRLIKINFKEIVYNIQSRTVKTVIDDYNSKHSKLISLEVL